MVDNYWKWWVWGFSSGSGSHLIRRKIFTFELAAFYTDLPTLTLNNLSSKNLAYMHSTSCEMPSWMKYKLESRLPGEISVFKYSIFKHQRQIRKWHCPYGRKLRGIKEPLDEVERGEWKTWLKAQHSKNEDHGIWSHHFMVNRFGNNGNSDRVYFLGLQNHCRWWLQPWN